MQPLCVSVYEEDSETGVLRTYQQRKLWTCSSSKNGEISVIKEDNSELFPFNFSSNLLMIHVFLNLQLRLRICFVYHQLF